MALSDLLRLRGVGSQPPPLPPDFMQDGPVEDVLDAIEAATAPPISTDPQTFAMEYVDSAGTPSRRQVTVQAIVESPAGHILLQCLCHMRGAIRTFRADRIQYIVDQNGEVIEEVEAFILDNLSALPPPTSASERKPHKPQSDRTKRRRQIRSANRDYIRVLVAIARSDGTYQVEEEAPINDFVAAEYGDLLDEADRMWLANYIHRMNPSLDQLDGAMENIAFYFRWARSEGQDDDKARVRSFCEAAKAIIIADNEVSEEELDILRELNELAS